MTNIFTLFKRITKTGLSNFFRNGWLSMATVSVLVVALFMILGLMMVSVLTESVVLNLQNRVDVSVFLKKDVKESDALKMQNDLLSLAIVKSVDYTSEEDALAAFRENFSDNDVILQSLDFIEENPLESSLNIKAKDPNEFGQIVSFLEKKEYEEIVNKINYYENEDMINNLNSLVSMIRKVGVSTSLILTIVALLVAFNTIRITIYTMKDEIGIMKLVGATNWFIRGPFIIEGIFYGFASSLIVILLTLPMLYFSSPSIESFFYGVNLFSYFQENIFQIWLILFAVGGTIGSVGSLIAMQKYLKV